MFQLKKSGKPRTLNERKIIFPFFFFFFKETKLQAHCKHLYTIFSVIFSFSDVEARYCRREEGITVFIPS